jgi:lipopolysaccharide transport system ATP-binding protein
MNYALRVNNLGKQYQLVSAPVRTYRDLREVISNLATMPIRRLRHVWNRESVAHPQSFWALQDVSFEIKPGEVVGIIGRNGAGKSTLLKILSRITEPTCGRVEMRGRIGSLLEVGTGFHPDLSGRENIYLNGAILGMTRREIRRKFDDIVGFSEIEQFLDTPVKRYSSGMYVRLAFAVAAHLEPEVLLVDEVLAVGDVEFQRKCLGKIQDVVRGGRTVFFVSHNLAVISRLCPRVMCLAQGRVVCDGPPDIALSHYLAKTQVDRKDLASGDLSLGVEFLDESSASVTAWRYGTDLVVKVSLDSARALYEPGIDLAFYAENGARVFSIKSDRLTTELKSKYTRHLEVSFRIKNIGLTCEQLSVDLGVRADGDSRYMACWQRIETVPISYQGAPAHFIPGTLVHFPCEVVFHDVQ